MKVEITYKLMNRRYTVLKEKHIAEIDSALWQQLISALKQHGDMYSNDSTISEIAEKVNKIDKKPPMGWDIIRDKIYYYSDTEVHFAGHIGDIVELRIIQ